MTAPRRPTAGRPSAGRRPARTGSRSAASRAPARPAGVPPRRPARLRGRLSTGRIAVLVLVVVTLLTSAALPLREFFEQRGDIAALQRSNDAARARVSALEHQQEQLQDPAYVAAEARRRLHFVMPGETAYVLMEPPAAAGAEDDRSDEPWYSQLWGSVREADRPTPTPTPALAPELAP